MKIKHHSIIGLTCKFFAPDKGGEAGGSKKPLSIEEQLTAAKAELTTVQGNLATITGERDTLRGERDSLQGQFDSATSAATSARAELVTAQGELATARKSITSLTTERDSASANVARLETLCGVKGINPSAAAPQSKEPATVSEADFETRIRSAKTPNERAAITAEFEKAVSEGRI